MSALDSVLFEAVSNVDLVTLHSQVKGSQLRIEHTNTQSNLIPFRVNSSKIKSPMLKTAVKLFIFLRKKNNGPFVWLFFHVITFFLKLPYCTTTVKTGQMWGIKLIFPSRLISQSKFSSVWINDMRCDLLLSLP